MPSVTMPNIGEGVTEGTVTRWLKAEGDTVERDEPLVEVETDKAVVEIPSPISGRLTKILVAEDETVPVGAPLAELEVAASGATPAAAPAQPSTAVPAEPPAVAAPAPRAESAPPVPAAPAAPAPRTDGQPPAPAREAAARRHFYSPAVLRLAAEQDVDLSLVTAPATAGASPARTCRRTWAPRPSGEPRPQRRPRPPPPSSRPHRRKRRRALRAPQRRR